MARVGEMPLFASAHWQMALGQRAALEGVLAQLQPALAIEIGTAQGGSLERIAAHSDEVLSFDFDPDVDEARFPNVAFHRGDSAETLPRALAELERAGRDVDFALVDGDHTYRGVKRDLEALLRSPAVEQTVILLHDAMNEECRAGMEAVRFEAHPKVVHVDLDFVRGFHDSRALDELWGGLGLVVVDREQTNYRIFDATIVARDRPPSTEGRLSWRLAAPLRRVRRAGYGAARRVKRRVRRRGRRSRSQGPSAAPT
jgi:hypothetical protein